MENLFKRSNGNAVGQSLSRVMSTRRSPDPRGPPPPQPADFSQLLESGGENVSRLSEKKTSLRVGTNRLFGKRLKELMSRNGIPELRA